MDENVTSIMEASGWYEGRRIDISYEKQYLEKAGYLVFPKVIEF